MIKIFTLFFLLFSTLGFAAGSGSDNNSQTDNSDQIKILYNKAESYIEVNKYKKSLKILKALTRREDLGGFRADIYNLLGFSYRKIDKPELDKSFAAYMMALEIDPKHLGAHEYLGELYLMMGNKPKAIEILQKLKKLAGSSSEEYLLLQDAINISN